MLIAFGGLPASGKTTLARALAGRLEAVYLRIDSIEQALKTEALLADDVGPAGYLVAYALAADNLRLGRRVIADSVNPLAITRDAWRAVARGCGVAMVEIEVVCSDAREHRRRVESRESDIPACRRLTGRRCRLGTTKPGKAIGWSSIPPAALPASASISAWPASRAAEAQALAVSSTGRIKVLRFFTEIARRPCFRARASAPKIS